MSQYLYGFTIYSIQSYIFQSNKLKEIAGASELVEQICTTMFANMINQKLEDLDHDPKAIRNAAGNIRYLFKNDQLEILQKVVREFPKVVISSAPGIQICQAVVEINNDDGFYLKVIELEQKITAQRNNPFRPADLGYMATRRSRRTGLPIVEVTRSNSEEIINDRASSSKRVIMDNYQESGKLSRIKNDFIGETALKGNFPVDFDELVTSNPIKPNYNWLAVIHIDANNMGNVLQNLDNGNPTIDTLRNFSKAVNTSTKSAAQKAFAKVISEIELNPFETIPFLPIIVGGDDLTIVCRADLALIYTSNYLSLFIEQTKLNFKANGINSLNNGLTACAGIAYVKSSYPFHYAIGLADKLCAHAKRNAKKDIVLQTSVPSCLMFHKVQDSFIEDFSEIIDRELTAKASNIKFDFGPYYIESVNDKPTIEKLMAKVKSLQGKNGNAIKSSLRQWLSDLYVEKGMAEQRMIRLLTIGNNSILKDLELDKNRGIISEKSPVYDWLTILSININEV